MTTQAVSYSILTDGVITGGGSAQATEDGQLLVRVDGELAFVAVDDLPAGGTGLDGTIGD